jgi:hypothetical protein
MGDTALMERVAEEVQEIRTANDIAPDQPVRYEPMAWTRRGITD